VIARSSHKVANGIGNSSGDGKCRACIFSKGNLSCEGTEICPFH
jgi:hypothetical protein